MGENFSIEFKKGNFLNTAFIITKRGHLESFCLGFFIRALIIDPLIIQFDTFADPAFGALGNQSRTAPKVGVVAPHSSFATQGYSRRTLKRKRARKCQYLRMLKSRKIGPDACHRRLYKVLTCLYTHDLILILSVDLKRPLFIFEEIFI